MPLVATCPEQADALCAAVRAGLSPLRVEPPIRLNEWMIEHFHMAEESSQTTGKWTPFFYQVALCDWLDDDNIEEFSWQKCARVGYTKLLLGVLAYEARHRRRNQALWQPTDDDRDSFVKTELEPMLRDVDALREVFPLFMMKSKDNTLLMKRFLGSVLHTLGAKSSKNFRRITVAGANIDEIDGMDQSVEGAGPADKLAWKRTEGALYRKMRVGSTPRIKGMSAIERRVNAADAVMTCMVECPSCGAEHPLVFGSPKERHGFKWDKRAPETVRHVCPHCEHELGEQQFRAIAPTTWTWISECGTYRYGRDRTWRFHATGERCRPPRHVGVRSIWTAYSPQVDWPTIVREGLEAVDAKRKGDVGLLVSFKNETLAQTYEDEDADKVEAHELARRCDREPEPYSQFQAPRGVLMVVVSADTQDNRWEIKWWGIGRDDERWVIAYDVKFGNPAEEAEWDRMYAEVMAVPIEHASGAILKPAAFSVDAMGHFTHQAYAFVRRHYGKRVFAIRGEPKPGGPIKGKAYPQDVNYRGKVIKNGVQLWYIGTQTAKDLVFGRLTKVTTPGPGYIHFPRGLPDEYYKGLTSEKRVLVKTARGYVTTWVKPTSTTRNEPWDTMIYCEHLVYMLDLHRYNKTQWSKLEDSLTPDLFGAKAAALPAPVDAAQDPIPAPLVAAAKKPQPQKFTRQW